MSEKVSYTLFSDGGGEKSSNSAGAAILETPSARLQVVTYLGGATNNEAEIIGGLTGFAMLRALSGGAPAAVRWVCDSEYVLKSATGYINTWRKNGWKTASKQPVKNRALWEAFLILSKGVGITPEHVRGHTGHAENESCDSACTWARMNAEEHLDRHGSGPVENAIGDDEPGSWFLIDGRPFLDAMRERETDPDGLDAEELLGAVRVLELSESAAVRSAKPRLDPAAQKVKVETQRIVAALEESSKSALRLSANQPAWASVQKKIDAVVAEIKRLQK